jgi:hypothetical protein
MSERQDSRKDMKKGIQESRSDRSKGREGDLCGKLKKKKRG